MNMWIRTSAEIANCWIRLSMDHYDNEWRLELFHENKILLKKLGNKYYFNDRKFERRTSHLSIQWILSDTISAASTEIGAFQIFLLATTLTLAPFQVVWYRTNFRYALEATGCFFHTGVHSSSKFSRPWSDGFAFIFFRRCRARLDTRSWYIASNVCCLTASNFLSEIKNWKVFVIPW